MFKELNLLQKPYLKKWAIFFMYVIFIAVINQKTTLLAQELHSASSGPVYPGGINALNEFINNNLKYPDDVRKTGLSGTVEVKFMINKEGKVSNIGLVKGINPGCDAEAIRLTGMLNDWTPGFRLGEPVNTYVCLQVEFKGDKKVYPDKITGKILEKTTDMPLKGILVIVKGTNIGTVSGSDGSYMLEIPSNSNSLEYVGAGYSPKEVEIDFHSTINVELDPEYFIIDFKSQGN